MPEPKVEIILSPAAKIDMGVKKEVCTACLENN
jgi:hypothetical protein